MRIGVISDTHVPTFLQDIPSIVREVFSTCELIIHAGDLVDRSVLETLESIAETKAVRGNMDSMDLRRSLPEKMVFHAGGKSIGVVHGKGSGPRVLESAQRTFKKKPDIVIFGHSHTPYNRVLNGTLFFNPGSAADRLFSGKGTFGLIEIDGNDVRGEVFEIK